MSLAVATRNLRLYWFGLASALVIAVVTPRFLNAVEEMGSQFFQPDMGTDYLKGLLWALFLGGSILLWPVSAKDRRLLLLVWSVKMLVTLGFMLFYEDFYSLDAGGYYRESKLPGAGMDLTNGTTNIIAICRLHQSLFPDSYHAMKVSFSMLGLIGVYLFYRCSVIFLRREESRLFYLFAFFPGVLFWSSILGKDPLVFFGIALYSLGVIGWQRRRRIGYLLLLLVGIAIATFIRQWLGVIMVVPISIVVLFGMRGVGMKLALTLLVAVAMVLCFKTIMAKFRIENMSDVFTAADATTKGFVKTAGGSTQQLDVDLTSAQGVVTFLPVAAFSALFRPFPGEVLNPFGLLAGLESAWLLYLLVLALKRTRPKELSEPLVLWALSFIGFWALVNGIVSSTNFGVGVRYRLQVLPLLLGLLMHLARNREGGDRQPIAGTGGADATARGASGIKAEGA
jgi:hypothetical protein